MILDVIDNAYKKLETKKWDRMYWAFDIHETMIKPNWQVNNIPTEFYPLAIETMQLISQQKDIVMILYTCSHPHEIVQYLELFKSYDIHFDYVNENPEVINEKYGCYDKKPYFNVLFEDKAGFDPHKDWERVLEHLKGKMKKRKEIMTKKLISHNESFISVLLKKYDDSRSKIKRNLINISEDDLDLPIYRIFSYERLQEILENNELGFIKPERWEDPFENWLLSSYFISKNGETASIMSSQSFVGQCWSLIEESDAMWRIYAPDNDGVKIKTTIRKLLLSLMNNVEDDSKFEISKFIGRVKYLDKKEIISKFQDNAKEYTTTNIGQATSHFLKRPEFEHENEVRILFKISKNSNNIKNFIRNKNVFKLKIEPNELIEEIKLDPRIINSNSITNKIKEIKSLGYKNSVEQSKLYRFENITFNLNL